MLARKLCRISGVSWCQWKETVQKCIRVEARSPQTKPAFLSFMRCLCSRETSNFLSKEYAESTASDHGLQDELSERGIGKSREEQTFKMLLKPDQPQDARILRVAIIGLPNSGKSTLTNSLLGWRVSTVSKKVHTTRKNTTGILTEGNTQIVFLDTPGILSASSRKRHKLERTLLIDPERSLHQANLVCVLVDVSNKWTRNELDPLILQVLHLHQHTPAVLILNKVDQTRSKEMLLQITRTLTRGVVDGRPVGVTSSSGKRQRQVDKEALFDAMEPPSPLSSPEGHRCEAEDRETPPPPSTTTTTHNQHEETADQPDTSREEPDLEICHSQEEDEEDQAWLSYFPRIRQAHRAVRDLKGWPLFHRVFMVSALSGDGVPEIKDYLHECAQPGDWEYHSSLVTSQDPQELVLLCVREKLLEHLHHEVPYNIHLDFVLWEVDEDGIFNIIINATAQTGRQVSILLGPKGQTIQKIASEAKQEMMNAFRCEMRLKIIAKVKQRRRR